MAPAPILSKSQFYGRYGNRFGAPGSGAYTGYVRHLKRARMPRVGVGQLTGTPGYGGGYTPAHTVIDTSAVGGPVQPLPRAVSTRPKHPTLTLYEQAQKLIGRALGPQIAATNASYDRESARQQASIAAATKEYEQAVAQYAPMLSKAYQQAQGGQASSDAALANLLGGQGGQAATNLGSLLGQPAGSEAAQGLQAVGRGAAAASYGTGSANLARLLSQGASAQEYGGKLPGLAALTGLQDTKSALSVIGQKRLDALGQLRATGATQTENLYEQMLGRRFTAGESAKNRQLQSDIAAASGLVAGSKAQTAQDALLERIKHDRATEANTAASTRERAQAAADRVAAQRDIAAINAGRKKTTDATKYGARRQSAFYSTLKQVHSQAQALFNGPASGSADPFANTGSGPAKARTTAYTPYQTAYNRLWSKYAPQLINQWDYKQTAVAQMVRVALKNAGYALPGSGPSMHPKTGAGRPG